MKNWKLKNWKELSLNEYHDIIQLREKIFIVEQNCSYLDVDGKDKFSLHLFLYDNDKLIAYTRLIPENISYKNAISFGRVILEKNYRNSGIAREMIKIAIKKIQEIFGEKIIIISAQTYLINFYKKFNFQ